MRYVDTAHVCAHTHNTMQVYISQHVALSTPHIGMQLDINNPAHPAHMYVPTYVATDAFTHIYCDSFIHTL